MPRHHHATHLLRLSENLQHRRQTIRIAAPNGNFHDAAMASTGAPPWDKGIFEIPPTEIRDWDRLLARIGKSSLEQSWLHGDRVTALYGTEAGHAGSSMWPESVRPRNPYRLPAMLEIFRKPQ